MQIGFFDIENSYNRLDKRGDPLLKLNDMIEWNGLSQLLAKIPYKSGAKGGRPPTNSLLLTKCLLLQSLYNLSDESCEYQVNDRLTFKRFLGFGMEEKGSYAK